MFHNYLPDIVLHFDKSYIIYSCYWWFLNFPSDLPNICNKQQVWHKHISLISMWCWYALPEMDFTLHFVSHTSPLERFYYEKSILPPQKFNDSISLSALYLLIKIIEQYWSYVFINLSAILGNLYHPSFIHVIVVTATQTVSALYLFSNNMER